MTGFTMARTAPQTTPRGSWTLPFIIGLLITFALGSVLIISRIQGSLQSRHPAVELPHIHGLGFSPEGQLMVPAHSGLQVFTSGAWQSPTIPPMDYMGFVITNDGFYSRGHPSATSNLRNPIGLVKSTDGGKTLMKLGFESESDFHLMGVGYHNHAIYVLNPSLNSKLGTGLYYSLDDGKTWGQSKADGITSQPVHVAVSCPRCPIQS